MRVLVVWCPDWPVVAAGVSSRTPAAVVAGGRVAACNRAAREAGVRRGLKVRDAQGRCAGLVVHEDDPDAQARLFEHVVSAVEAVSPRVEVVRPGLLAIPARGPARYYGGEQAAADSIRAAVDTAGFECAVGVADGSFAAALAARCQGGGAIVPAGETAAFLAPQSVVVLDRPELTGLLVRLGIRTLGDLAALPERDVIARFGPSGGEAHRLAGGRDPRPPSPRPPGEDLSAVQEFDPPLATEPVVFAAKALADHLHEELAARGLVCVRVEVEATLSDGRCSSRLWRHDGLLSSTAVAERVRWQLDPLASTMSGARRDGRDDHGEGGVVRLRLIPDQIVVAGSTQLALWGADTVADAVDRVATRVQVMLGHAGVTRPVLSGGHGPGERVVKVPWGDRPESITTVTAPWPGQVPEPFPAVVHPRPVPVAVTDAEGRPVTVSGRCEVSAPPEELVVGGMALAITGWTGPWPVAARWWDAPTARRVARFQMVTDDGRAWLLLVEGGRWSTEASYD